MEFTFTTELHYLIHFADGEYVAHCLDMDLVGTGDSIEESLEELNCAVRASVFFAVHSKLFDILSISKSAPERYWEMFDDAKKQGNIKTGTLNVGPEVGSVAVQECRQFVYTMAIRRACTVNLMPLEKELARFEQLKGNLVANHNGKFALIKGDEFLGAFDSAENAYAEGVKRFGRDEFLVRRVSEKPEVYTNKALSLGLLSAHYLRRSGKFEQGNALQRCPSPHGFAN